MTHDHVKRGRFHRSRRGLALLAVLAALAIVMTVTGLWVRSVLDLRRRQRSVEERGQAVQLAESGLRRAAAQLARDRKYEGETWVAPADELGASYNAVVQIRVVPAADGDEGYALEAVVRLPQENTRLRLTRHGSIVLSAKEPRL